MQELIKRLRSFAEYEADLADESKWERIEWEAADLIESQAAEIEKYKALCDQMGNALNGLFKAAPGTVECNNMHHAKKYQHAYDETCQMVSEYYAALEQSRSALEAWRALK